MAKDIEPGLKKIGEYLKIGQNSIFVIPEYQRAYSWDTKQCDKLWQDIEDFIESGGTDPYFFGTIIINCQDDDTKLSLIDGQQRTITFILLLKALLIKIIEKLSQISEKPEFKKQESYLNNKKDLILKILYKGDDEELYYLKEEFKSHSKKSILENNSINELHSSDLIAILNSQDFDEAEEKVIKFKYKQKDNKYTNYFRNFKFFYEKFEGWDSERLNLFAEYILGKSEVIQIKSWNVEQAITMFNSLNSDGLPLLDADIISAKLYSKSGDERDDFNDRWQEFKENVSILEENKVCDIDDVLKQFMYINRARTKEYITQVGTASVTTPGLRRYYTEINKELLENPLKLTSRLLKISKIWLRIYDYPLVEMSFKFNENIKIFLISYLYRFETDEISEVLVETYLKYLLKLFAVLDLVETGYSSKKFKAFLFELNIKAVDPSIEVEDLIKDIQKHIEQNWSKEELVEDLYIYSNNPLIYLHEYILSLEEDKKFELPDKYEIEHIMPKSGKNLDQIREDAGLENSEEFKEYVNKLGNKILLEENINRSIGNAWFRTKIQSSVKEKKGYKDSQFLQAQQLVQEYKDKNPIEWCKEDIRARTEKVSQEILEYIFEEI